MTTPALLSPLSYTFVNTVVKFRLENSQSAFCIVNVDRHITKTIVRLRTAHHKEWKSSGIVESPTETVIILLIPNWYMHKSLIVEPSYKYCITGILNVISLYDDKIVQIAKALRPGQGMKYYLRSIIMATSFSVNKLQINNVRSK